jgi:hypothetical protein
MFFVALIKDPTLIQKVAVVQRIQKNYKLELKIKDKRLKTK